MECDMIEVEKVDDEEEGANYDGDSEGSGLLKLVHLRRRARRKLRSVVWSLVSELLQC
jgi:hypothetical protein